MLTLLLMAQISVVTEFPPCNWKVSGAIVIKDKVSYVCEATRGQWELL